VRCAGGGADAISLSGGVLAPAGSFHDAMDASARFGLRAEFQPVNAIGRKSTLSFVLQGHYTSLTLDSAYKEALVSEGQSTDAWMLDVGGGIRVYSRFPLFFITAGGGWVRTELGGETDEGVDVFGGAGVAIPLYLFLAEGQVTAHSAFFGSDDLQHLDAIVSLAMPF
jgi:hypothetical protein